MIVGTDSVRVAEMLSAKVMASPDWPTHIEKAVHVDYVAPRRYAVLALEQCDVYFIFRGRLLHGADTMKM
jgi:hypothetical protein